MGNPRSVSVLTNLRALSAFTSVLPVFPRDDAFEDLAPRTFPLFDGKVVGGDQEGKLWVRLEASDPSVPEIFKKMAWCYMLFENAHATSENIVRSACEILEDAKILIQELASRPQSVILRSPAPETGQLRP